MRITCRRTGSIGRRRGGSRRSFFQAIVVRRSRRHRWHLEDSHVHSFPMGVTMTFRSTYRSGWHNVPRQSSTCYRIKVSLAAHGMMTRCAVRVIATGVKRSTGNGVIGRRHAQQRTTFITTSSGSRSHGTLMGRRCRQGTVMSTGGSFGGFGKEARFLLGSIRRAKYGSRSSRTLHFGQVRKSVRNPKGIIATSSIVVSRCGP